MPPPWLIHPSAMPEPTATPDFALRLIDWQRAHGRHDLPWQQSRDPYRVWLSEIMLQQTQVSAVIPYYQRFLARFPDVLALAAAAPDEVLALWSGLGYYARARNLHRAARVVVEHHGGVFPASSEGLAALPGIGRSTAAAIAAFCFGERAPILDGNVKRVLCRHFGVEGFPGERAVESRLWALAEALLPVDAVDVYIQALMDLGATLCTRGRPGCQACPLGSTCVARREGRVADLPAPRPRRVVPLRRLRVLVLQAGARVLLEERPPAGIWGGLWSLPGLPGEPEPLATAIAARLGQLPGEPRPLPVILHTFTHFRLELQPWWVNSGPRTSVQGTCWRWVDLAALDAVPLPAPIRRILASLAGC